VQRKVFRIEQMAAAPRWAAPAAEPAAQRHAIEQREAPSALVERRGAVTDTAQALKRELVLTRDIIAGHKRDMAALIGDAEQRRMARAAGELGATIDGMDKAAQSILNSAECIDDGAKALAAALKTDYERGLTHDIQDHVVQIYEACNFQDLAGQRIGKVIAMLSMVEEQLAAMLARCNGGEVSPCVAATPASNLVNGPKLDGDTGHASQRDIDAMFNERLPRPT
jgi:chemotaxis protein CheZ